MSIILDKISILILGLNAVVFLHFKNVNYKQPTIKTIKIDFLFKHYVPLSYHHKLDCNYQSNQKN